jgi:hypothetical protein
MPDLGEDNLKLFRQGQKSISQQAHEHALASVKPDSFTVGGHTDGTTAEASITIGRKWSNGFGATAYIRGWWNDAPVTPNGKKWTGAVGGEITKTF